MECKKNILFEKFTAENYIIHTKTIRQASIHMTNGQVSNTAFRAV